MKLQDYLNQIHDDKEKRAALKAAAKEGREQEFLAAEGVELPEELSDDVLSQAAGGLDLSEGNVVTIEYKHDSRGNPTHWKYFGKYRNYEIYHYVCPNCGRILHKGTLGLFYCDPCDNWYLSPEKVVDEEGTL